MNNKLMKIEDNSFFHKIKAFIFKLFYKQKKNSNVTEIREEKNKSDEESFIDYIKIEDSSITNKNIKLKQFMNELEKNPDIVENLSDDRLDKLLDYYEKTVEEKKNKVARLKLSLNTKILERIERY